MSTYSADNQASGPPIDAKNARVSRASKPRKHSNASRVQLAYTTKWSLDDLLQTAKEGRATMEQILEWAKQEELDAKGRFDQARLVRLGRLNGMVAKLALQVARLERVASDARVGIYEKPNVNSMTPEV